MQEKFKELTRVLDVAIAYPGAIRFFAFRGEGFVKMRAVLTAVEIAATIGAQPML